MYTRAGFAHSVLHILSIVTMFWSLNAISDIASGFNCNAAAC